MKRLFIEDVLEKGAAESKVAVCVPTISSEETPRLAGE
jgi:hypothetical protein